MFKAVAPCLFAAILPVSAADVVISQIYTAGGNSGATYQNDFVELHNRGGAPVSLNGWTLQYATTNFWFTTALSGTLQPGQYYLVEEGSSGTNGINVPPPNSQSSVNLNTSNGKIALVNNNVPFTNNCPSDPSIVDLVGYGVIVNCSEGAAAQAPGAATALFRAGGGCTDTGNNGSDFSLAAPNPRNTFSPFNVCLSPVPVFIFATYTNAAFTAGFTTNGTASNQVQFSFDLASWTNLPIAVSNAGSFLTFTDTNAAARRFYRVVGK